ncbi:MAG: DUF3466 family protein [Pirellulaceae bacterium]
MKLFFRGAGLTLLVVAVATATNAVHAQGFSYSLTDLGTYDNVAIGISASGGIVGTDATVATPQYNGPISWNGTSWDALPYDSGDQNGAARQVSADGTIVGWSSVGIGATDYPTATKWVNGNLIDLGVTNNTTGFVGSATYSISQNGQYVSGAIVAGAGVFQGFIMDDAGNVTTTGNVGTNTQARNYDVNNLGHAAGQSRRPGLINDRATYYSDPTGLVNLGVLAGDSYSRANALNDADRVVGWSWRSFEAGESQAFIWTELDGMQQLMDGFSQANDINNNDWIVGRFGTDEADARAFLYTDATGTMTLNNLLDSTGTGWDLLQATAIDESGRIIGWGRDGSGNFHSFLLTPNSVPEPAVCLVWRWL